MRCQPLLCLSFTASINTYMSFLESSQCLLVLVSDGTLADDWCRFILNYALQLESRNIVFVLYRKVTTWTDSPEDSMLRRAIKVASHKVTWPDMVANDREISNSLLAVCLNCFETNEFPCCRRFNNHTGLDEFNGMGQGNIQESQFQVSYIGDRSTANGNCNGNSSVTDGVHVSNTSTNNGQGVLSNSEVNSTSLTRTIDSSSSSHITTCCCYPCHSVPDPQMLEDNNRTPPGRQQISAREARFWKQLRLALPPKVHRPACERSEPTMAETATLTANIIWMGELMVNWYT